MVRPEALHRFPPPHMPGTLSTATGTTELHSFPGTVPGGNFFCSADPTPFSVASIRVERAQRCLEKPLKTMVFYMVLETLQKIWFSVSARVRPIRIC